MKMTILEAKGTLAAATLAFCLFFSDSVEAVPKGSDCTHATCDEGLYCVKQSKVVQMYGIVPGIYERCVECKSDYDCPASISCNDPLTPIAMCDWGAQKTFPGIDGIRKGYNGYKSDPLMYKSNSDPGFDTEGYLFKWDYMESGTSAFTFNNELYDVPRGYFVNVEESCSMAMNTNIIQTEFEFKIASEASVKETSEEEDDFEGSDDEGDGPGPDTGKAGSMHFSTNIASSLKTVNTQATCIQYIIEVDKYKLSSIPLDDHLVDFLVTTGSTTNATKKFDYNGLFDMKGTHYVKKAWIGSKFGITQTISSGSMVTAVGAEASYKEEMSEGGSGFFSNGDGEAEGSVSANFKSSVEENSESLNKYSIGSSNIISLEDWSESSKLNPEVVKSHIGSICKMLNSHDYNMAQFLNWSLEGCELEGKAYTNKRICYDVEVNTCTDTWSGTDAALYLSMYGKVGDAEEKKDIIGIYMNDRLSGNAFENGQTDKFSICDQIYIGEIYKINIRGGWDDWRPANVKINGLEFNYGCRTEINYAGLDQVLTDGSMPYNIVVETAACDDCGIQNSDTVINLKIIGKFNDAARTIDITNLGEYSDATFYFQRFQNGEIDNCLVKDQELLTSIDSIAIQSSNLSSNTWTVSKITINGHLFVFNGALHGSAWKYNS